MSNNKLFCKYLEAGAKSSAVVLDPGLITGNEQTIYLYHQQRDQIIEYRRDIVESKLRELKADEAKASETLVQAYEAARAGFTPRGAALLNIPEKGQPAPSPAPRSRDNADDDADGDDIGIIEDDDLLDEDEEVEED